MLEPLENKCRTYEVYLHPDTQGLPVGLNLLRRVGAQQLLKRTQPLGGHAVHGVLDRRGMLFLDRLEHANDLSEDIDRRRPRRSRMGLFAPQLRPVLSPGVRTHPWAPEDAQQLRRQVPHHHEQLLLAQLLAHQLLDHAHTAVDTTLSALPQQLHQPLEQVRVLVRVVVFRNGRHRKGRSGTYPPLGI